VRREFWDRKRSLAQWRPGEHWLKQVFIRQPAATVSMRVLGISVSGWLEAEGDLDFRGTLGIDPDASVGFQQIRLIFNLQTTASAEDLQSLLATTERYCVVLQTLLGGPAIATSVNLAEVAES
jgi:hypothetical protein